MREVSDKEVHGALAHEVGCEAASEVFGTNFPLTLGQISLLGLYVLRERARKYREGHRDAYLEFELAGKVDKLSESQ